LDTDRHRQRCLLSRRGSRPSRSAESDTTRRPPRSSLLDSYVLALPLARLCLRCVLGLLLLRRGTSTAHSSATVMEMSIADVFRRQRSWCRVRHTFFSRILRLTVVRPVGLKTRSSAIRPMPSSMHVSLLSGSSAAASTSVYLKHERWGADLRQNILGPRLTLSLGTTVRFLPNASNRSNVCSRVIHCTSVGICS